MSWFLIVSGEGKGYLDVSSGVLFKPICLPYTDTALFSFGLLHRIPPPPGDRELGIVPPELFENPEEFEDQQLFVPADFSQSEEQYNGWGKNFHTLEEEGELEESDTLEPNEHDGHAHDYDHGHGPHAVTPFRLGSSTHHAMTPTQTRPGVRNGSGTYTNGDSRP